jgi:hypothetical protein
VGVVRMATHNPYEDRLPRRRVVTREQLNLAKVLRRAGVTVEFDGEPDWELNYLALTGLREWLSDPIVLTAVNLPVSTVAGLIANSLSGLVKRKRSRLTSVVIEADENGTWVRYDADGRRLTDAQLDRLIRALDERYEISHGKVTPADPSRPVPIYLEHTDRIVAWGRLSIDDVGLRLDDAVVVDDEIRGRIDGGELNGGSIGALVREATCSVCGESFFDCEHVWGETNDGTLCSVTIVKMDLGEVSLVQNPAQLLARIRKRA